MLTACHKCLGQNLYWNGNIPFMSQDNLVTVLKHFLINWVTCTGKYPSSPLFFIKSFIAQQSQFKNGLNSDASITQSCTFNLLQCVLWNGESRQVNIIRPVSCNPLVSGKGAGKDVNSPRTSAFQKKSYSPPFSKASSPCSASSFQFCLFFLHPSSRGEQYSEIPVSAYSHKHRAKEQKNNQ